MENMSMKILLRFIAVLVIYCIALPSVLLSQNIYWTQETYGNARLRKATKAGAILIDSVAGADANSRPQAIAVDPTNNKVYWAGGAFAGADIFHAGLDLATQDSLHKNGIAFRGIALDVTHGKIYWTSVNLVTGPQIRRSNLDGSGDTVLIDFYSFHAASESLSGPKGIALDIPDGKLFWTDDLGNRIRTANLDGSDIQTVESSGISGPLGIALDLPRGKMYWTEAGPSGQKIQRANLDGSVITSLITGLAAPGYIELDPDSNAMYWTEAGGAGSIRKATLAGSSPATVISGLADPAGIVLPHISTPDSITANPLSGQTTASVSFLVQATGNPMIQTNIGGTVITSPHTFQPGTTTVTCTIPGNADSLTASFTVTVPVFARIGVSPDSLGASLAPSDSTSQTLTISNTGSADLTFMIVEQGSTPGVLTPRTRPGSHRSPLGLAKPYETPRTYTFDPAMYRPQDHVGGNSAIKKHNPNAVPTAKARTVRKTSSAGLKVLLVNSDDDNSSGSPIQTALLSYPDIGQVDLYDSRSGTPSLSLLQGYDDVVAWTDYSPSDPAALGNVLADYVDQGGSVVLGVFDWSAACGWGLSGRIMDPAYAPLTSTGACDHDDTANMVILEPSHPIMSGVSSASDYFRDYTSLTAGSELVAKWDDNENMVAVKGHVVSLNSYVGIYNRFTGDIPLILHNSIAYLADELPWLSEDIHSGTVPAGGSENVTVTFNAHGLANGDYYGNLLVASNDATNPTVTVPVHLHVDAALPIQLASLTATVTGGSKVRLDWTTITETNNYGFYVERRPKTATTFTTVSGLIPGAGTSLALHQYSWTDSTATSGAYVYRLRQVDLTGNVSYSQDITVNAVLGVNDEAAPRVFQLNQNFPNPFNPTSVIKFSVGKLEHASVKVYNILGEEVAQLYDGMAEPGHYYNLNFDGSQLGSGMYFYRIITDSHTAVRKMLMLK